jgi:hypothetical protein
MLTRRAVKLIYIPLQCSAQLADALETHGSDELTFEGVIVQLYECIVSTVTGSIDAVL